MGAPKIALDLINVKIRKEIINMGDRMDIKATIAKIALEVKEELAKKSYKDKDKDKELVYIVALSIAKYVQELEKL